MNHSHFWCNRFSAYKDFIYIYINGVAFCAFCSLALFCHKRHALSTWHICIVTLKKVQQSQTHTHSTDQTTNQNISCIHTTRHGASAQIKKYLIRHNFIFHRTTASFPYEQQLLLFSFVHWQLFCSCQFSCSIQRYTSNYLVCHLFTIEQQPRLIFMRNLCKKYALCSDK